MVRLLLLVGGRDGAGSDGGDDAGNGVVSDAVDVDVVCSLIVDIGGLR